MKKKIKKLLKKALEKLEIDFDGDFNLDHPQDLKNGDWTTNIAMLLAGRASKNPREFAEQIRTQISENDNIEKVEIAGPGYLNFYLSKKFFREELKRNFAEQKINPKENEKILLEHSSINLFKPFHIGHIVNNSIGESLTRILKFSGNEVLNLSFLSDVSPGIAKTVWAIKNRKIKLETLTLKEIGKSYVYGVEEYENNKEEIDKINIQIYNNEKGDILDIYNIGKNSSLEYFKKILKKLGSEIDDIIYESEAEVVGKKIVRNNIGKVFKESEGAIIFEGKNYTNVFINSQNFGTYLTKDIGLLKIKKEKWASFNKSLVVTDIEQKQHFEMIKESGEKISEISDFVKKSEYLQHGRMTFSGNIKISSRYGNVPLASELIERVQKNILEKMKEREFSEEEKNKISEKLAIATLKYTILKVTSGKNIAFDIEKDTNPQGDTATFLLYTYVRTQGIYRKIDENLDDLVFGEKVEVISDLEKILVRFDETVEKSAQEKSPHYIAKYLFDLAQKFNSFYEEVNFSDRANPDFNYNFALLKTFGKTMEHGLELLGIETVEKM